MAVPTQILDGTPPHGTMGTVTINSVAYIVEDEKVTPNWSEASDRTAAGLPNRKRWTKDRYGLELKLQLASSATAYPPPGMTFQYTPKNEATALTFIVIKTPEERNNEESFIETVTITCEQAIGSVTTS
jgi:hypothetical protein